MNPSVSNLEYKDKLKRFFAAHHPRRVKLLYLCTHSAQIYSDATAWYAEFDSKENRDKAFQFHSNNNTLLDGLMRLKLSIIDASNKPKNDEKPPTSNLFIPTQIVKM